MTEETVSQTIAAAANDIKLDLSRRGLTALPPEIARLTNLQVLWLTSNQLTALPSEIGQLANLRELSLDSNRLAALPPEIGQLANLRELTLELNNLTALPPEIAQLANLEWLALDGNDFTTLPPGIAQLAKLEWLSLDVNHLTTLPPEIAQLTNLRDLVLDRNWFTVLPPEIGQLANLEELSLANNQLTALPVEIAHLAKLERIRLDGNRLDAELAAAARSGVGELRHYLGRLAREGERLYEAKLLLVGEGEVGKSSLLGALRGDPPVEGRDSTHGLEIKELCLDHPSEAVRMTLQGWDFGGQAVYRPTHQLFFSAPGLYLVVWKPREGPELNFVEYWIRLIKHRAGPGARVVVVATHRSQGRVARLDEPALRAAYGDMIVGFHYVDSLDGAGIPELAATIASAAAALPGMGRGFPASWRRAREILEARVEPYLSYGEYEAAVAPAGLDRESAASLARNSHELGYLIHYADDPGLADMVVLRPDWLSRAISYVLEDQVTVDNKGLAPHARLAALWHDDRRPAHEQYDPAVHPSLVRLMEHFDLSYRIESPRGTEAISLIAQLVPPMATLDRSWSSEGTDGRIELTEVIEVVEAGTRRPAIAEGLVFQLIVRLHRLSLGRRDYRDAVHWSGGLVLDDGFNGRALVTVTGSQVEIRVRAAYPQFLMGQVAGEVRWLVHTFWKGLDAITKVPCRPPCVNPGAGLFDTEALQRAKENRRPEFPCPTCGDWQRIDSLLSGVVPHQPSEGRIVHQLQELHDEVLALRHRDMRALRSDVSQGFQEMLSRGDELFEAYLRTLDDEAEHGPRLFTLAPRDASWKRPGWIKQRFRLTLYCEHSRLPLSVLGDDPLAGVYHLDIAREWVRRAAPVAKFAAGVLSVAMPAARAMAEIELGDAEWERLQTEVEGAKETLAGLVDSLAEGLGDSVGDEAGTLPPSRTGRHQNYSGADLRQLHELLDTLDVRYGGLAKVRNNRRQPLWVHPRYVPEYRPPPPVMLQPSP